MRRILILDGRRFRVYTIPERFKTGSMADTLTAYLFDTFGDWYIDIDLKILGRKLHGAPECIRQVYYCCNPVLSVLMTTTEMYLAIPFMTMQLEKIYDLSLIPIENNQT